MYDSGILKLVSTKKKCVCVCVYMYINMYVYLPEFLVFLLSINSLWARKI